MSPREHPRRPALESLEPRLLLNAGPGNLDSHLLGLWRAESVGLAEAAETAPVALDAGTSALLSFDADGRVAVDVWTLADPDDVLASLAALGFESWAVDDAYRLAEGALPAASLAAAAGLEGVLSITTAYHGLTRAGSVVTQGDAVHNADDVRALDPAFDGSGVKVGVLSDSAIDLADSQATGDLPADVERLLDFPANDEGRALLEIVHDLAPGAALSFRSVLLGEADFAQGIRDLAAAGANVIVDDVILPSEPFFQDGLIAQAVEEVVGQYGLLYVAAAGNEGLLSYEADFADDGAGSHDFDPDAGTDTLQTISLPDPGAGHYWPMTLSLQWDQPFYTIDGVVSDFDVLIYDATGTTLIASSTSDNLATQQPLEVVSWDGEATGYTVAIHHNAGPTDVLLKYVLTGPDASTIAEYATDSPTVVGHPAAAGALAVGAVPWDNPGTIEPFSSRGPATILFDAAGNRLASPEVRTKPDVVAVDGVATSVPGFADFTGTSAAAPHAAGVAAQMWSVNPHLTRDELYTVLTTTAVDLGDAGADDVFGYGRLDALAAQAAAAAMPDTTAPAVMNLSPTGTVGWEPDAAIVRFSEPLNAATASNAAHYDLREAGPDEAFDTADDVVYTVAPSYDNATRTVTLTFSAPAAELPFGSYRLTLDDDITDPTGNALGAGAGEVHAFAVTGLGDILAGPWGTQLDVANDGRTFVSEAYNPEVSGWHWPQILVGRFGDDAQPDGPTLSVPTDFEWSFETSHADVAMGPTGGLVTYTDWLSVGTGIDAYYIRLNWLDAAGRALGERVHVYSAGGWRHPPYTRVATNDAGRAAVVFDSWETGSDEYVMARLYNADGSDLGPAFRVSQENGAWVDCPVVGVAADGSMVVAWHYTDQENYDGSRAAVVARRFDAAGNPLGDEFLVNTTTADDQRDPALAVAPDGSFVIAWRNDDPGGVFFQRYDAAGNRVGGETRICAGGTLPDVAIAPDGRAVVVYQANDDDGAGVWAQRLAADGAPVGEPVWINTGQDGEQTVPRVGMRPDGDFVVSWLADGQTHLRWVAWDAPAPSPPFNAGPWLTQWPERSRGADEPAITTLTVTFNEPVDPASFTPGDVRLATPMGTTVCPETVSPVPGSGDRQFELTFAAQNARGTYVLTVGPNVLDLAGSAMDEDGDGVGGEADDAFSMLIAFSAKWLSPAGATDVLYFDGFEDWSVVPAFWSFGTETYGIVETTGTGEPHAGATHLYLSPDVDHWHSAVKSAWADLRLDLSAWTGEDKLLLDFWRWRHRDPDGGLYVSGGDGNWVRVDGLGGGTEELYEHYVFDLDEVLAGAGIALDDDVRIRFRVHDYDWDYRQLYIDDLRIMVADPLEVASCSVEPGDVVPAGPVEIVTTFQRPVDQATLCESAWSLAGDAGSFSADAWDYDPVTYALTVSYDEVPPSRYTFSLSDTITDEDGNGLDGDGDGTPEGDFVVDFLAAMGGDIDLNGRVDRADLMAVVRNFGHQAATWADGDANGDAVVNSEDYLLLKSNLGTSVNYGLWFDGHDDAVRLDGSVLREQTDVTIEFWAQTSSATWQAIVSAAEPSNDNELLIALESDTTLSMFTGESQLSKVSWTIPPVADGQWHHFAVVRDDANDQAELLLDGVSQGVRAATMSALWVYNNGLILGQDQDQVTSGFDPDQAFAGCLDEVRFWSAALTGEQIRARMAETLSGAEADLLACFSFSEGQGQYVANLAGGTNGTLGYSTPGDDDPTWIWAPQFPQPAPVPPEFDYAPPERLEVFLGFVPTEVLRADLNGDGADDLVAGGEHMTAVVLTDGAGGLAAPQLYAGDCAVGLLDADEDGRLDILTDRAVLLQLPDGSFTLGPAHTTAAPELGCALGDVDNDGHMDFLAKASSSTMTMYAYYGDGSGGFVRSSVFSYPLYGSRYPALGDLNGDGLLDAVATDSDSLAVRLNLGSRQWSDVYERELNTNYCAYPASIADFDDDGHADLMLSQVGSGYVRFFPGLGDGTFAAVTCVAYFGGHLDAGPTAVADFDQDGLPDVVACSESYDDPSANTVAVIYGDAAGAFDEARMVPLGSDHEAVAAGDFDGDGWADLAVASAGSGSLSVLLNDAAGGFGDSRTQVQGALQPDASRIRATVDLDGDGLRDLAYLVPTGDGDDCDVYVAYGQTDGTFTAVQLLLAETSGDDLIVGYLDETPTTPPAERHPDLILAETSTVLLNTGGRTWQTVQAFAFGSFDDRLAVGDFNGDGLADVIDGGPALGLFLGRGDGTFTTDEIELPPRPDWVNALDAGDLDGDGLLDLVACATGSPGGWIGWGHGDATFDFVWDERIGMRAAQIADVNGDGRLDLVDCDQVYLNAGARTFHDGLGFGGEPIDANADGVLDLVATDGAGHVTVRLGDGHEGFSAPRTWTCGGRMYDPVTFYGPADDPAAFVLVLQSTDSWAFWNPWRGESADDQAGPRVLQYDGPMNGGFTEAPTALSLTVSEPLEAATVHAASVRLASAGADGLPDTNDDLPVAGAVAYDAPARRIIFTPSAPLGEGLYRFVVSGTGPAAVTDTQGNALDGEVFVNTSGNDEPGGDFVSTFFVADALPAPQAIDVENNDDPDQAVPVTFDANRRATVTGELEWRDPDYGDCYDLGSLTAGDVIFADAAGYAAGLTLQGGALSVYRMLPDGSSLAMDSACLTDGFIDSHLALPIRYDGRYVVEVDSLVLEIGLYNVDTDGTYSLDLALLTPADPWWVEPDTQVVYLDFDGHADTPWGPVGAFDAAQVGWDTSLTAELTADVVDAVLADFTPIDGVQIVTTEPTAGAFSRVTIGLPAADFAYAGDVYGIAQSVNAWNTDPNDQALVAADAFVRLRHFSLEQIAEAIGTVASHEAGHLLGLQHVDPGENGRVMQTTMPGRELVAGNAFSQGGYWWHGILDGASQNAPRLLRYIVGPALVPPTIGSFTAEPSPVVQGGNLDLEADGFADADGTVEKVAFYRDADGNGTFDADADEYLTADSTLTYGASRTIDTDEFPPGVNRFFAVPYDNDGIDGTPAVADVTVLANEPPVIGSLVADKNPVFDGETLYLSAQDVFDPAGEIDLVWFYRDDGDGVYEQGAETVLGYDPSPIGGWTKAISISASSYPPGDYRFFAVAEDEGGLLSEPATVVVTVPLPPNATLDGTADALEAPTDAPTGDLLDALALADLLPASL